LNLLIFGWDDAENKGYQHGYDGSLDDHDHNDNTGRSELSGVSFFTSGVPLGTGGGSVDVNMGLSDDSGGPSSNVPPGSGNGPLGPPGGGHGSPGSGGNGPPGGGGSGPPGGGGSGPPGDEEMGHQGAVVVLQMATMDHQAVDTTTLDVGSSPLPATSFQMRTALPRTRVLLIRFRLFRPE
jgi:hypothetical protein